MLTAPYKTFFHCRQCKTAGRGVVCNVGCGDAWPVPWGSPLLLFAEREHPALLRQPLWTGGCSTKYPAEAADLRRCF